MNHIILAAGEGTRLRPLTLEVPKCMVPIQGAPLIEHQMKVNKLVSFDRRGIVTGYKREKLNSLREKYRLEEFPNERYFETNMLYSLFCAEKLFDNDLVISYGDIVYSKDIFLQVAESQHDVTIAIDKNWHDYWSHRIENPLDDAETLGLNGTRITDIGRKATSLAEIQGQYIGLLKFSRGALERIAGLIRTLPNINGKPFEKAYMTDLLQQLISIGWDLQAKVFESPWIEIDSVKDHENPETQSRLSKIRESLT